MGFVCVDADGKTVGSAYGTCPAWINDIGGAEAWAMLQATLCAMPGHARFWTDCQPLLTMISKGQHIAEDPKNIYARVHSLLMPMLDDTPLEMIGWMPSHTTVKQVGKVRRGDGELLTIIDCKSNDIADRLAKKGASLHRVPATEVNAWKEHFEIVKQRAMWIGTATSLANHGETYPFRDSEAARWKAEAAARARSVRKGIANMSKAKSLKEIVQLPVASGGHLLVHTLVGKTMKWKCTNCLNWSARWATIAPQKCSGKAASRWASVQAHADANGFKQVNFSRELSAGPVPPSVPGIAAVGREGMLLIIASTLAVHNEMQAVATTGSNERQAVATTAVNQRQAVAMTVGNERQAVARTEGGSTQDANGHSLVWAGNMVWCRVCASYAEAKAHCRGIGGFCRGAPARTGPNDYGGMWGQLQKLRNGIRPRTGRPMPAPTDRNGQPIVDHRRYTRLDAKHEAREERCNTPCDASSRFVPYIPQPLRELRPYDGRSAKLKMQEMALRVRTRELEAGKRVRLRGKQKPQSIVHG